MNRILDYTLTDKEREEYKKHLMPAYRKSGGLDLKGAKGIYLEDMSGKRYMDFTSGMFACILGYANEEIAETVYEQAKRLTITAPLHQTDLRLKLCHELIQIAPPNMDRVHFTVGGGPAIESAMKIARKNVEGAEFFVTLTGGYHGTTIGSMSATFLTSKNADKEAINPVVYSQSGYGLKNCIRAKRPYRYREKFEGTDEEYGMYCADRLREVITNSVPGKVAGVIMEPLQSAGGQITFPEEYLRQVRKLCDELGILLIFDEIQTFCRTREFFAANYYGVKPDIIAFAKGVGGGIPVAGIMIDEKLAGFEDLMEDMQTFQHNQLGLVAALKTIEIVKRDNLLENVEKIGAYMTKRLEEMQQKFPQIGEIRGPGLAIGVEMVKNPISKEVLEEELLKEIFQKALEKGLFLQLANNVIKLKPAITISREEAELAMDMLEKTFEEVLDGYDESACKML